MNSSTLNTPGTGGGTKGWVPQSTDRGTLDIVLSCGLTIFLCTWTSVCVNVPTPDHGAWAIFKDRWHMFCLGVLGPDFVLLLAVGQYCSAKASEKAFARSKIKGWTLKHAFFADMGGIHLELPNHYPELKSFPINAKQLHFMVANEYIPFPSQITEAVIDDKNKYDGLSRLICTLQIFWFSLSTISRLVKGYATTTLELTTLAYIYCALATLFFWRCKPMDIRTPVILICDLNPEEIVDRRGRNAAGEYFLTPLDFVGRQEWIGSRLWKYYVELLRKLRIIYTFKGSKPIRNISSFNFPLLNRPMLLTMVFLGTTYAGIFVAGWNFHYPTWVEQVLWRVSTLGTQIIVIFGGCFEVTILLLEYRKSKHNALTHILPSEIEIIPRFQTTRIQPADMGPQTRMQAILQGVRNKSDDPELEVPLRSLMITTPLCALYCLFRLYILVEDFLSLRRLPESAFVAIAWSTYLPHF